MRAIRLHRVSNPSQAESDHHSIFAQQNRTSEYLSKTDFEQLKVYDIEGESAYRGPRKKFRQIENDIINSNECIAVVVDRVDRFQRDFREVTVFDDFRKDGKCELHFIKEGLVLTKDTPKNKMVEWHEKVLDAEKYSAKISENVLSGLEGKRDRGQRAGQPPLGYMKDEEDLRNKVHVPDSQRWDLVNKIWTLYSQNLYSDAEVGEKVSDLGLRTRPTEKFPKGCPISKHVVRLVLQTRFYIGEVQNCKFEWIRGAHQPMVDEALFDKCQRIRNHEEKQSIRKRTRRVFYPFRGLMVCGFCGSTMTFQPQYKNNGKKYVYCKCASQVNKRNEVTCEQKSRTVEEVKNMFSNFISQITIDDKTELMMRDFISKEYDDDFGSVKIRVRKLDEQLKSLNRKKSILYDDRLSGDIDIEFYKMKAEEIDNQMRQIRIQIKELEVKNPNHIKDINRFIGWCKDLNNRYSQMDEREQTELASILGSRVVINGKDSQFEWNKPFEQLAVFNSCPSHDRDA